MIGFLLVQDIIVILLLPMLSSLQSNLSVLVFLEILFKGIVLFGIGYLMNKFILPKAMDFASKKSNELFFLATLSIAFVFISIAVILKFNIAVGAFVGGLAMSTLPYNIEMISRIKSLRDFFATIFFVTLGMQLTFSFTNINFGLVLAMFAVVLLIKPIIFFIATFLSGYGSAISFLVGAGLAQVSEFSFILLSQGYANGTGPISADIFSQTIIVIAISMAISPYFMNYSKKAYNLLQKINPFKGLFQMQKKLQELNNLPQQMEQHTILVGCGALGKGILEMLHSSHPIIAIDNNPETIHKLIKQNFNAIYGSADNDEIWEKVSLQNAGLLIITIPNIIPTMHLVDLAKKINPNIVIFARAHYYQDAAKLYQQGVDYVVIPEILASNTFIKQIAKYFEEKNQNNFGSLKNEFENYLKEKTKTEKNLFKL